jgi:lactoylglutathione lyase
VIRHVKFAHLPVRDQDRALAFYCGPIGMALVIDESYGGGWRWIELAIPGGQTRLLFTEHERDAPSERPSVILVVDDVDDTYADLTAKGVEFTQEPAPAPWAPGERHAIFRDSEGNLILIGSD